MSRFIAVNFNDLPNILHLIKYTHHGASVVDLKLQIKHPRNGEVVIVYYRKTSLRGNNVYYYTEGTKAGEALGG